MSNQQVLHLNYKTRRSFDALVVGRAGLDLYPEPDGGKIKDATSFSSDLGGSAGNIAVAIAKAGSSVGLISAVSNDAVGEFVKQRLQNEAVDISLLTLTHGNERTSLALAEVRHDDCQVVIYRNDAADLKIQCNVTIRQAISNSKNLVVTGTSLIDIESRKHTLEMMRHAVEVDCHVWLDLDYRAWNWPNVETTRQVYREAVALTRVVVGNEDEFSVLTDDIATQIKDCKKNQQILILKRGAEGSSLFTGESQLDSGIYTLKPLKPYGSGDAFVGNLLVNYLNSGDWLSAVAAGSAAAALVVSTRGCASAMPNPEQLDFLQQTRSMSPAADWR